MPKKLLSLQIPLSFGKCVMFH